MSMLVEFSVVPVGKGVSISPQITEVLKIVAASGVSYKANPMGTYSKATGIRVRRVTDKGTNAPAACRETLRNGASLVSPPTTRMTFSFFFLTFTPRFCPKKGRRLPMLENIFFVTERWVSTHKHPISCLHYPAINMRCDPAEEPLQ